MATATHTEAPTITHYDTIIGTVDHIGYFYCTEHEVPGKPISAGSTSWDIGCDRPTTTPCDACGRRFEVTWA